MVTWAEKMKGAGNLMVRSVTTGELSVRSLSWGKIGRPQYLAWNSIGVANGREKNDHVQEDEVVWHE